MKEKVKKIVYSKVWNIIDIFLILFLLFHYVFFIKFSFQLSFVFPILNILLVILSVFRIIVRFILIFKERKFLRFMNILFVLFFLPLLFLAGALKFVDLIFPLFYRDTYYFSENFEESFTSYTYFSGTDADTYIFYEKELGFGIKCIAMIDYYHEIFNTSTSADKEVYKNYIKNTKLNIDYNKHILEIEKGDDLGFCYHNLAQKYESENNVIEYFFD